MFKLFEITPLLITLCNKNCVIKRNRFSFNRQRFQCIQNLVDIRMMYQYTYSRSYRNK